MPVANLKAKLSIDGKKAQSQIKSLSGRVNAAFSKIKPLAGMLIGGAAGYALMNATKKVMDFDVALTRLAIQGGKTAQEMKPVRASMLEVSADTGIAKEQILDIGKAIIDTTGDFDFMNATLHNTASLAKTTGSDATGLGKVVGALGNTFGFTADEADRMMRILVEQGEKGSWTLEEMATSGTRVFSAARQAGIGTVDELRDFTAYMQVFRTGFASGEQAATAYQAVVASLGDKAKQLEGKGIKVFDDSGKQRNVAAIMMDTFEKFGTTAQDLSELNPIFGREAMPAITAMAGEYEKAAVEGKNLQEELSRYTKVQGSQETQQEKLNRIMDETGAKFEQAKARLEQLAMESLLTKDNLEALGTAAEGATAALVAAVAATTAVGEGLGWLADLLGLVTHGGRAEDAADMTPEQVASRQAMFGAVSGKDPASRTEQERAFMAQYQGSDAKKKFMGMDTEDLSLKLGTGAALAAGVGALPLAALLGAGAVAAPKIQGYVQDKEAEKFEQSIRLSDEDIDKLASSIEKGAEKGGSRAKPTIEIATPLSPAGGTAGELAH
ncbi:MAG TPA: phage tail tape measure protein, partial [Armatimonadota bacterium]|nr:phage tail tape measure protein [Armatimonadota bacterium]